MSKRAFIAVVTWKSKLICFAQFGLLFYHVVSVLSVLILVWGPVSLGYSFILRWEIKSLERTAEREIIIFVRILIKIDIEVLYELLKVGILRGALCS